MSKILIETATVKLALSALKELVAQTESGLFAVKHDHVAMQDARQAIAALKALAEQQAPVQEPLAWVPYLSDRADGVSGHYAIARWNPRGYREVWNIRRHAWGAYSDDVLCLEEADTLLRLIEIPTRKVETPQPAQRKPLTDEQLRSMCNQTWVFETVKQWVRVIEAAHGITKGNT